MGPSKSLLASIQKTCPPDLLAMIEAEGNFLAAARAAKMGGNTVAGVAKGKMKVSPRIQKSIDAYHAAHGSGPITADKPSMAEVTIPPWNRKVTAFKINKGDGKKINLKKVPVELVELIKRNGNVLANAAKAIGYSSWSTIMGAVETGKYEMKFHERVYRALHGLPIPSRNGGDSGEMDAHTLGLAICVVALSEYERLEELAAVMNGHVVFRMASGAGTIVIFRIADRGKRETFKRLGSRDAKKIVCP